MFSASEAYAIENGKLGAPLKGATLIGNGPDVLTRVSMVGNDLKLDEGVGTCGKEGQNVPVGVGQPPCAWTDSRSAEPARRHRAGHNLRLIGRTAEISARPRLALTKRELAHTSPEGIPRTVPHRPSHATGEQP